MLLSGPPGSGKSMLAKRLPSILPRLSRAEALETTNIYSVSGLTSAGAPFITQRPFRSPHHTISPIGLSGGSSNLRPGEISLAHNGVLFLDELPEFPPVALEILRQPLEDGQVTISRAAGSVTYPSRFMLVCAMNPCKCGWYGHPSGRCTCTEPAVQNYQKRISGPLLDRIDIFSEVPSLEYEELRERSSGDSSETIRGRVDAARELQRQRYREFGVDCNAYLDSPLVSRFCTLSQECESLMKSAFVRLGLTARSYDRTLRVARTIADLDGGGNIQPRHLAEAIQYRRSTP